MVLTLGLTCFAELAIANKRCWAQASLLWPVLCAPRSRAIHTWSRVVANHHLRPLQQQFGRLPLVDDRQGRAQDIIDVDDLDLDVSELVEGNENHVLFMKGHPTPECLETIGMKTSGHCFAQILEIRHRTTYTLATRVRFNLGSKASLYASTCSRSTNALSTPSSASMLPITVSPAPGVHHKTEFKDTCSVPTIDTTWLTEWSGCEGIRGERGHWRT